MSVLHGQLTSTPCCTQVALVEFCMEADDLKQAVAAGRRFGLLDDTFPTLERAYKSRTISKLAAKRQWAVAAAVAGDDPQLQVHLCGRKRTSTGQTADRMMCVPPWRLHHLQVHHSATRKRLTGCQ
jgi:hypothetical protein